MHHRWLFDYWLFWCVLDLSFNFFFFSHILPVLSNSACFISFFLLRYPPYFWFRLNFKINLFPKNVWYSNVRFSHSTQINPFESSEFRFTWMLIAVPLLFIWSIEALITSECILYGLNQRICLCLSQFLCSHPLHLICYWTFELVEESFHLWHLVMVKAFELNKKKQNRHFLAKDFIFICMQCTTHQTIPHWLSVRNFILCYANSFKCLIFLKLRLNE